MRLFADEGVDAPIVNALRAEGHDVTYIAELSPGLSDDDVLRLASQSEALLITQDKDFGDLVVRLRLLSAGVMLLRFAGLSAESKPDLVIRAIGIHADQKGPALVVVSPSSIRVRPLRVV